METLAVYRPGTLVREIWFEAARFLRKATVTREVGSTPSESESEIAGIVTVAPTAEINDLQTGSGRLVTYEHYDVIIIPR